jgi:hypothetical protein
MGFIFLLRSGFWFNSVFRGGSPLGIFGMNILIGLELALVIITSFGFSSNVPIFCEVVYIRV